MALETRIHIAPVWVAVATTVAMAACSPAGPGESGAGTPGRPAWTRTRPRRVLLLLVAGLDRIDEGTPQLADLAAAGALFPDVVAPSPDPLAAAASALTSRRPRDHGVGIERRTMPARLRTVGSLFRNAGFATFDAVCDGLDMGLAASSGFDQVHRLPDRTGDEAPLAWLAEAMAGPGRRLGVALLSSACPRLGTGREPLQALDGHIGGLLERLQARTDPTTLTVVAGLPEGAGDAAGAPLHGPVLHVSIVVHRPGGMPPLRGSRTHSLLDLLPTVADLAGLDPGSVAGQSLVPILLDPRAPGRHGFHRRPAFAEAWQPAGVNREPRLLATAIVFEGWKLTRSAHRLGHAKDVELYDHVSDPDDLYELSARYQSLAARLLARLDRWQTGDVLQGS